MHKNRKVTANARELAKMYMAGMSLQEIGDIYDVTRERIRQILVKAGFVIKEGRQQYKLQERVKNKVIADELLVQQSCDIIEKLWKRAYRAEHLLCNIKKRRKFLIDGFKETLFAIKSINTNDKIKKLINEELLSLDNYVLKLEENCYEKDDAKDSYQEIINATGWKTTKGNY